MLQGFFRNHSPSSVGQSSAPTRRSAGHRPMPAGQPHVARYRETPIPLWRAISPRQRSNKWGLIDISVQFHRWQSRSPRHASQRSSDRDYKLIGPNPFLTPFNVFGPLTSCRSFGVHSKPRRLDLGLIPHREREPPDRKKVRGGAKSQVDICAALNRRALSSVQTPSALGVHGYSQIDILAAKDACTCAEFVRQAA